MMAAASRWHTDQFTEPNLEKLDVERRYRQLQRIESGGFTALERKIFSIQGTHQNLEAAILVEDHLRHALPGKHCDQKADEDSLAGTCWTAYERMTRVLAASPR